MQSIYLVVQGLFEKSDSIGFDCVYQFRHLRGLRRDGVTVRLFCETFDATLHPGADIEPIADLYALLGDDGATIIYHYCDGWPEFEARLGGFAGRLIVRWHNNTPPWFFAAYARGPVERTVRGYEAIVALDGLHRCEFWVNSPFSARQLEVVGVEPSRTAVVYPASRYLTAPPGPESRPRGPAVAEIMLLFVGRLVPHKGHRHVLMTAARLSELTTRPIKVVLAGRADTAMARYVDELKSLAAILKLPLELPGEIDEDDLRTRYGSATCLVFLSEHEGFGLPVFEAMRAGTPIVAWANTALADLMAGHPYAMPQLDYDALAHAVLELTDEDTRAALVRTQDALVASAYSPALVAAQLAQALARSAGAEPAAGTGALALAGRIPREIPDNYFTLYDLASYGELLEAGGGQSRRPAGLILRDSVHIGDWERLQGVVDLPASRFAAEGGQRRTGAIILPLESHARSGLSRLRLALDAGDYTAGFDFELVGCEAAASSLTLEASAGDVTLARSCITVGAAESAATRTLAFALERPDTVELRLTVAGSGRGVVEFSGLRLSRLQNLGLRDQLQTAFDRAIAGARRPRWRRLDRWLTSLSLSTAGAIFRPMLGSGDRARDRRDWATAAARYRAVLRLNPRNAPMWVQLGHMLKESKRWRESGDAYDRARALTPLDPDIYLNLGHLMKLQDRLQEAVFYYQKAADIVPAPSHARHELAALGVPFDT